MKHDPTATTMTASRCIRQIHRWTSLVFTLTVVINFAVRINGEPAAWITYSPLLPLGLLQLTGLYLFVLPHSRNRRSDSD
jgi:hypothetical protein